MDRYAWRSTFPPPAQRTNLTSKLCCLRRTALRTSCAVASYPPYFCRSPSKWLPVRNNSLLDMFIKCTLSNLVLGNKQVENPELSALSFPHYDACLMPSIYGESRCTAKLLLRFSTLSNHKRVAHTYAPVIGPCGSHHIISIMIIGSHIAILLLLTLANSLQ